MAKRRAAEPLTFHVPWKRLLLCEFPEEPPPRPPWIPPAAAAAPLGQPCRAPELPRKRKVDAGAMTEPSASPSKRHDDGDTSVPGGAEREGHGWETSEPPPPQQPPLRPHRPGEELQGAQPPRGGGDSGAGRAEPPPGDWGTAPRQVGAARAGRSRGGWVAVFPALPAQARNRSSLSRLVSSRRPQRRKAGVPAAGADAHLQAAAGTPELLPAGFGESARRSRGNRAAGGR